MTILKVILAFLFPPLSVWLQVGFSFHFWLNIVLTLIGFLPGALHALWVTYSAHQYGTVRTGLDDEVVI